MPLRTKFLFFSIAVGILFALTGLGLYLLLGIVEADYNQFSAEHENTKKESEVLKGKMVELEKKNQAFAEYLLAQGETSKQLEELKTKLDLAEKERQELSRKIQSQPKQGKETKKNTIEKPQTSREDQIPAAVAKISPAVVSIVVSKDVPKLEVVYVDPFGDDPFFKDFSSGIRIPRYRQKGTEKQKVGAGTGFIIKQNGLILTNKHVVGDATAEYTVLLADGSQKKAEVLYLDSEHDLALINIEGSGYRTVELGNSDTLKLGQSVGAIGNALGEYSNSVSVGIISGLNRSIKASTGKTIEELNGVIQTDAAINPGNSGGPLFTLDGKVIGVNVATVVGSSNISFSIPINEAKERIKSYLK